LGTTSFSGMANLFVPILIAALIVLNTMMGSVYERFREIGIYSSVGLAPGHIAWLFMAESCVYSVLGVVAGYLVGQTVAKVLISLDLLTGFTLNYSSLSAVFSSMLVMAVVLLSTVYPARKASQMAVPDVTRKWKLPPPEGDEWNFEFPFTVSGHEVLGLSVFLIGYFDSYSEESIGTFYTDGAHLERYASVHGDGYSIDMNIWLAPFDLGVSQHVVFRAVPEPEHHIYSVTLQIRRLSGENASWRRVNQRFMNVIRKQFLIWRTVDPEAKAGYRQQGEEILAGERSEVTA
ncbi:MAG: FtsX-like permease family protein, partial [Candidatus Latescibacterota bacterium]